MPRNLRVIAYFRPGCNGRQQALILVSLGARCTSIFLEHVRFPYGETFEISLALLHQLATLAKMHLLEQPGLHPSPSSSLPSLEVRFNAYDNRYYIFLFFFFFFFLFPKLMPQMCKVLVSGVELRLLSLLVLSIMQQQYVVPDVYTSPLDTFYSKSGFYARNGEDSGQL